MDLPAWWTRLPGWAKWLVLFGGSLALALPLGYATPLGPGNAVFLAGAAYLLASVGFIGLGREHRVIIHRTIDGQPMGRSRVPAPEKRVRNQRGLFLFSVGLALWACLLLVHWLR